MITDADRLYSLLKEVFLLLDDGDRQLFSQYQLSESRFYALFHLGNQPGVSSRELSDLMFCDKSNITRLIKALEADKLVTRWPHETDRRAMRLYLTPAGERVRQSAVAAHRRYNAARFDSYLSDEKHGGLFETLRILRDDLGNELHAGNEHYTAD